MREVLPRSSAVALDAAYRPAVGDSIGGSDWYEGFELPDERIALAIGDVAGKGPSAALVMRESRRILQALLRETGSPSKALSRANFALRAMPMMVTALIAVFDPKNSVLTYASAGHPAPFVVTPDGQKFILPNGDLPLGVAESLQPNDWTFTLQPGWLLVLYTDGIVMNGPETYGGEGALMDAAMKEFSEPSEHPAQALQDRILGTKGVSSDVATMTMSIPPRARDTYDCVTSAVPFASPFVRKTLDRYLIEKEVDEDRRFAVITAVCEAIANSIEHAYGTIPGNVHLWVRRSRSHVCVHIEDAGHWRPPTGSLEERGRGIPLMRALMDRVDILTDHSSTQIRMQLRLA